MTRRKMNQISGLILLAGFVAALVIFLTAEPPVENSLLNDPRAARNLTHDLRVMGGRANVLASDFQDWFSGLWEGRALAGTVAVIAIGTTVVFRFFATLPPRETKSGS